MQFRSVALADGLLLLSVGAAAAAPATVIADLDLYTGSGSEYQFVDVMPPRIAVNVFDCGVSWCRVARDDGMAYANHSDLDLGDPVHTEALPSVVAPMPPMLGWHHGWRHRYWHHLWYQPL
jgi:hypothetical protein